MSTYEPIHAISYTTNLTSEHPYPFGALRGTNGIEHLYTSNMDTPWVPYTTDYWSSMTDSKIAALQPGTMYIDIYLYNGQNVAVTIGSSTSVNPVSYATLGTTKMFSFQFHVDQSDEITFVTQSNASNVSVTLGFRRD